MASVRIIDKSIIFISEMPPLRRDFMTSPKVYIAQIPYFYKVNSHIARDPHRIRSALAQTFGKVKWLVSMCVYNKGQRTLHNMPEHAIL